MSVNQFKVPARKQFADYDFDQEEINLSLHMNSVLLKPYFDEVDLIVNDCMIDVNDKIERYLLCSKMHKQTRTKLF